MSVVLVSSPTAPASARRRAGAPPPASASAEPALIAEPAANTNGSSWRASCHTGIAVSATSTAVYVASAGPANPAAWDTFPSRGIRPNHVRATPSVIVAPAALRIHEPTLIGDVGLNTRSMFRKRDGRRGLRSAAAG